MRYNHDIHKRKSIRLKGYDYSRAGMYFITICTYNRDCLFGEIVNEEIILNEYGRIVEEEILKTAEIRKNIKIDKFVIMPNHIHLIIEIITDDEKQILDKNRDIKEEIKILKSPSDNVGAVVRGIKSQVTANINKKRDSKGIPIWHKNYYENIIRNEEMYLKVAEYIENNPRLWKNDKYFI